MILSVTVSDKSSPSCSQLFQNLAGRLYSRSSFMAAGVANAPKAEVPNAGMDEFLDENHILFSVAERLKRLESTTRRIENKLAISASPPPPSTTKSKEASSGIWKRLYAEISHHNAWWLLILFVNAPLLWFVFGRRNKEQRGELATTIGLVNLLVTVAVRDGTILLLLYKLVIRIPFNKYFFNRMLHCLGGLHTGCGMMILLWNAISLSTSDFKNDKATAAMLLALCIGLAVMMVLAMPVVRHGQHNTFERVHRYLGWSLILLFLAVLLKKFIQQSSWKAPQTIAGLTLMGASLFLVFYSWFIIERRTVELYIGEQGNVVIVRMRGLGRAGAFARISFDLVEWHSFSVAFTDRRQRTYGLVVGVAGDWTTKLARKCLTQNRAQVVDEFFSADEAEMDELEFQRSVSGTSKGGDIEAGSKALPQASVKAWIRWHRPLGFMYSVYAYTKVLCVGTGAGIAPILPHIGHPSTLMHVLWIAKDHLKIYGSEICNIVLQHPHHTLHDTRKQGRPEPSLTLRLAREFGAEAIFVVSNAPFTESMRAACLQQGVPTFGAVFDS